MIKVWEGTTTIEYDEYATYTQITISQRIEHGESGTRVATKFTDGLGRSIQSKVPTTTPGKYLVSGEGEYDNRGLPVKQYIPRIVSETSLDTVEVLDTNNKHTIMTYDEMGRVTRTDNPDTSYSDVVYDDWTTEMYDMNGHRQDARHDAYGRLIEKIEYVGADGRDSHYQDTQGYTEYARTHYAYDSEGNLITTTNEAVDESPADSVTQIGYDKLGRKIWLDDPDMGNWTYEYDLNGNLKKQIDARNQTIIFSYDELNRLTRKTDNADLDVDYTYDTYTDPLVENGVGRLTKVEYNGDSAEFYYDELGRERRSVKTIDSVPYPINREYNAANELTRITYPDGKEVFYKFNILGQVIMISNDVMLLQGGQSAVPQLRPSAPPRFPNQIMMPNVQMPVIQGKGKKGKVKSDLISYGLKFKSVMDHIATNIIEHYILGVKSAYADPIETPWQHTDVGTVGSDGDASQYDGVFNVQATSGDLWDQADSFHFVYQSLDGDGEIVARVDSMTDTSTYDKAGVMIRESLSADSKNATMLMSVNPFVSFQYRVSTSGTTASQADTTVSVPRWVKMVRSGNQFTGYYSSDGQSWTGGTAVTIIMDQTVYVGLAVAGNNVFAETTAGFSNVRTNNLPDPWISEDVGPVTYVGSSGEFSGSFTVQGSGDDIWGVSDEFQYAYQSFNGDGVLIARVDSVDCTHTGAKAAIMMREALNAGSKHALMVTTKSNLAAFQYRNTTNGDMGSSSGHNISIPYWIKLERTGNVFNGYLSADGTDWTFVDTATFSMEGDMFVGLAVTSNNDNIFNTSVFSQVSITQDNTLPPPWQHGDIGSTGVTGDATETGDEFTVQGSGIDIWGTADEFHYVYQPLNGSGQMIAKVQSLGGTGTAKAGIMFRENLDADSKHAFMLLAEYGGGYAAAYQYRWVTGGEMGSSSAVTGITPDHWVKLVRRNNDINAYESTDGSSWNQVSSTVYIDMDQSIYAGLALTNNNDSALATAVFSDVIVQTAPAAPELNSPVAGDSKVTLSWQTVSGADGYVIRFGETQGGSYTDMIDVSEVTTYDVTDLDNGTTYYFVVSAYNNTTGLEGSDSNEELATPQITAQTDPPTAYIENVIYSDLGQIDTIEYGNGTVTRYEYNLNNFRLERIYTTDLSEAVIQDLNYKYDKSGNILEISNEADQQNITTQTFIYDHLNRLISATATDSKLYGTRSYSYDEFGNITEKDGKTYEYSGISAGPHAVTSTDDGQIYTEYTYDANGNMETRTGDGVVTTFIYDVENRLIEVRKENDTIAEYAYDGDGGRVKKIDYTKGTQSNTCFIGGTMVHMADGSFKSIEEVDIGDEVLSFNEKTGEKVVSTVTGVFDKEYTDKYLLLNGWLGVTDNHLFYSQGEWRKIGKLSMEDALLGLDLTDRQIESVQKIDSPRMVRVYNIEVDQHHNYFVGSEGYLVHNKMSFGSLFDDGGGSSVFTDGLTTVYIGAMYEKTNGHTSEHVFMGSSRVVSVRDGFQHYYHADHLGGLNVRTGGEGYKKEEVWYQPFGKTASREFFGDGEEVAHHYFTGQHLDDETGLYYFNARYYDPSLGRFITPDTIVQSPGGNPQTFNRYSYCGNNPVNYTDPTGHFFWAAIVAIVKAASAAVTAVGGYVAANAAAIATGAAIGGAVGGVSSVAMGGNFWQGFGMGAIGGGVFAGLTPAFSGMMKGVFCGTTKVSLIGKAATISNFTSGFLGGAASGAAVAAYSGADVGDGALIGGAFAGAFSLARDFASYTRRKMIAQSSKNNSGGKSYGWLGDGKKLAGHRKDLVNKKNWVSKNFGFIFGGPQDGLGQAGLKLFGKNFVYNYSEHSVTGFVFEMWSGPHDYLNSWTYQSSGKNIGNIRQLFSIEQTVSAFTNPLNVAIAAPIAVTSTLPGSTGPIVYGQYRFFEE
ncbi:MAG: fibronectin type III domain-containing protein [Candidatus Omnitrophica bacterium]|nr:fibronectin type III domain-containing protein [Candidatus Omnitrophota bacterium]